MFYDIKSSDKFAIISSEGVNSDASSSGVNSESADSEGVNLTYSELARETDRFSDLITGKKLVFCLCENSAPSLIGYIGVLMQGSVSLLLDKKIDTSLLSSLIKVYRPHYMYVPKDIANEFTQYDEIAEFFSYVLLAAKNPVEAHLHEDLALLLTTSGSTGSPKLVRQSYENIQSNAEAIAQYLEITSDERPITTLPMNYTYGLSIINSHLLKGATILMTEDNMTMKAFWNFARDEHATSFGGVPFTYEMLKKIKFFKKDLPDLRYMTQAGGKLSPKLHKEFAQWALDHDKKFIVMYGQTEATARMGYLSADKSIEKYGSMGKAIPGGRFILTDIDGNSISKPNIVGELVYEGPNVTLGYAQCLDDLSKGDERGGYLETGDMAKMDEEGYFYIVGRKKRFLKIYGSRVNLDEIDALIKKVFEIDCASTGVDDHLRVFITNEEKIDDVKHFLISTVHLVEMAFEVCYIEKIPKNEAGKVLYKEL